MSQEASTLCRSTAVFTNAIVATRASARRRGPAGTCCGSLKTSIGVESKTSWRFPVFGKAITRAAAVAASPSASAIQRSRRRTRGEPSGFRRPCSTGLAAVVGGAVRHHGRRARYPAVDDPLALQLLQVDVEQLGLHPSSLRLVGRKQRDL